MRRSGLGVAAAAAVAVLLGAAACSGSDDPEITLPTDRGDDTTSAGNEDGAASGGDSEAETEVDADSYVVAEAVDRMLTVRSSAQENADELLTLSAADEVSGRIVCLVSQQIGDWVEVYLPSGGLDRTGWVARDDVTLSRHRFHIEVSISEHTLTLFTGDDEAFTTPVGVGPDAPEPGAALFIKDLVKPPDPDSPYGEYAYGLSGSANDMDAFTTGNGVVAVHGTGDPTGIGEDVRYGSLAIGRDVLEELVDSIGLPLGTPVTILE
jgi:lipoprotein-anchoring transpeptidase ErfK/SrfK